jgi:CRISPR-associated endonuclease/helicase Cas3
MNEVKSPYFRYWGKTAEDGSYHLLPYHCLDVVAVGNEILNLNLSLLCEVSTRFEIPEYICRSWLLFFLALHDLGKFSTSFQNLKPEILKALQQRSSKKVYTIRHDCLGFICWSGFLREEIAQKFLPSSDGREVRKLKKWLNLWAGWATGHHGIPPLDGGDIFNHFDSVDRRAVLAYVHDLNSFFWFDIDSLPKSFATVEFDEWAKRFSWILAGFVTLCDWVGSNAEYFPFLAKVISLDDYWEKARKQAHEAIAQLAITPSAIDSSISFASLYPDFAAAPTPLQIACDKTPIPDEPQLWILEDVTGAGKTEAAVTLAGRISSKGLGQGTFVALPTMATSNAMYERMGLVYSRLFQEDSCPSLVLAHGSRHLSKEFRQSFFELDPGKVSDSDKKLPVSAQCACWLADSAKKSLLADVGIGTLDQVLLGILPARHQSLRLYGLRGKVLIVDEVHSYDPYMTRLLEKVLEFHASLGGSAILLSATLPASLREGLCQAFQRGLGNEMDRSLKTERYPLITQVRRSKIEMMPVDTRDCVRRRVRVVHLSDIEAAYTLIEEEADKGRCICWIRNTVQDVREGYETLVERGKCGIENLMVFHSRFALLDRLEIEQQVLGKFGKKSQAEDRTGQVLIASQVVEQSLDLDFDVLISDLAPIDLLIQRAGRLHRHQRLEERGGPVLYLHGPEENNSPDENWYKKVFPKASHVYPDAANLWRTQKLLLENQGFAMPEDARKMVEGVYGEEAVAVPDALIFSEDDYWAKEASDRSMASYNGLFLEKGYLRESSTYWDEEVRVPTRLGEIQRNLFLALKEGEYLEPLHPGEFAWDQSMVKVRASLLKSISLSADEERLVVELFENNRLFRENDLIVPLRKVGDCYFAEGLDSHDREVVLKYDCRQGLFIQKPSRIGCEGG